MTLNKNINKRGPGKRGLNFLRVLKDQKCDPEVFLARVVNNDWQALGFKQDQNPVTLDHRIAAAKALMPYRWPQLKAMEIEHINPGSGLTIVLQQSTPPPVENGDDAKVINGTVNGLSLAQYRCPSSRRNATKKPSGRYGIEGYRPVKPRISAVS